ncbi:PREDICTED: protein TRANSPARENT TESTA 12-like [Fragaria vesca subsp. vesca]|uniref:protein TRANSPARENT TESTA 12-like n=1 Tax=Fragaria vesca subsp. vesca TaxID=101020 RepID=UPI0002C3553F|nr:PREDICTED: protein TRANSPARENT TESTA 12-like [Fragaria vesca subsp. vesca]
MEENRQPLLSPRDDEVVAVPQSHHHLVHDNLESFPAPANPSFISSTTFNPDSDDIPPIKGVRDFFREFNRESKKLWFLAGPAIFTSLCQYSLGAVTQVFAGQVSTLDLAAVSVENSVIAGFCFGALLGMGSALETLCGQAFGAGQLDMLGIYMQRSWVILNAASVVLCFLYIFAQQILYGIGQTAAISKAAGVFAIYMIPQLFAYAMIFPLSKFLQSQSKMMVMAAIAAVTLILHTVFSWLLMLKLGWGLVGAAVVLDASWWIIVVAQMVYIVSGTCGRAWTGFSWKAFHGLWGFVKLSLASAVMLCLEVWYFMALILFAGYLKNAEISVDGLSICMNILGWTIMMSFGMNAAISVRVSNELGAGHPRTAKFSLVVAVISSFLVGVLLSLILIISRNQYPALFSSDAEVQALVVQLTPLLATCIVINNVQPVLSGVAIGAGWQAFVAYVNIGCYYIVGVPLGLLFGYYFDWGVEGIWIGMLLGTVLQTCVLFYLVYKTNWNKEASIAEDRIRKWGGQSDNSKDRENNGAMT